MKTSKTALKMGFLAIGTFACACLLFDARATQALEVTESERQGEWDEAGSKFGEVVIKGELVADAQGWVLVRTVENRGDEPVRFDVEERVLRTETMLYARVNPPAEAVVDWHHTLRLAAHEKRRLGVRLSEALAREMTGNAKEQARLTSLQAHAIETGEYGQMLSDATFYVYDVDYLKPLPLGATAAKREDYGVTRPMRLGDPAPLALPSAQDPFEAAL